MTLVRVSGLLALRSLLLTLLSVLDLFLTLGHAHSDHARFGPTHRSIEHAIRQVDMIRPNQVAHHQKAGAVSVNHSVATGPGERETLSSGGRAKRQVALRNQDCGRRLPLRLVMQHFAIGSLLGRVLYPYFSRSSRPLRRTIFL